MIITKWFCNSLSEHCIFMKISIKFNFILMIQWYLYIWISFNVMQTFFDLVHHHDKPKELLMGLYCRELFFFFYPSGNYSYVLCKTVEKERMAMGFNSWVEAALATANRVSWRSMISGPQFSTWREGTDDDCVS